MKAAQIFKLSDNHNGLSNAFIRIRDKRTPFGNYFFRLDKLDCVSILDNSGLTPLLEVSGCHIEPSVTYEQFISFIVQVFNEILESDHSLKIFELIVDDKTVRDVPPRTRKTIISP